MKTYKLFLILFLAMLFTFCSSKTDQEMYDDAVSLISEKKYDEAVIVFEELVSNNSNSELAPKALFECAKIYQGQVIKNLSGRESLEKSVEVYKKVVDDYPTCQEAENSLFMAGFILANELKDLNAAKETYEMFLEKYPNGPLADDAKVELQNLGKTPEEILLEKIQKESSNEKAI